MGQHVGPTMVGTCAEVGERISPIDLNLQEHCCDNLKHCIVNNRQPWTNLLHISSELMPFPVKHTILFSSHMTILFTQTLVVKRVNNVNHFGLVDIIPESMDRSKAVRRQDGA
jgi:hypothetical protein